MRKPEQEQNPIALSKITKGGRFGYFGAVSMATQRHWYPLVECWGTNKEESHRAHIVPSTYNHTELMRREGTHLVLIQYGAPSYATTDIKVDERER